jgi:hypothetical protein
MWWKWRDLPPGVTARISSRLLPVLVSFFLFLIFLVGGSPAPDDLRTAHSRSVEEMGVMTLLCMRCFQAHISSG